MTLQLTPRQREVATLFAAGLTLRTVGARIGCSEQTARIHMGAVYLRLGIAASRACNANRRAVADALGVAFAPAAPVTPPVRRPRRVQPQTWCSV